MKFVRYGELGNERPGVLHLDGTLRDLGDLVGDIDPDTLASGRLMALDLAALDALPRALGGRGSAARLRILARLSGSVSTIASMQRNPARRFQPSPSCS